MNDRNTDFLNSLSSMTPSQTGYDKNKRIKNKIGFDSIGRIALVIAFLGIFAFSVDAVIDRFIEDMIEKGSYTNIIAESAVTPLSTQQSPDNLLSLYNSIDLVVDKEQADKEDTNFANPARYAKYRSAMMALKNKYPDVYGWIVVTGTNIDYPVLKGDTNDTYIRTDYKGNHANGGSIFVEASMSDIYDNNLNTVVYGHNMTNGTMFRALRVWFESANRNSTAETMRIEIYTEDALYVYKPFSAYRRDGNDFVKTSFSSYGEFVSYLDMIKARSIIPANYSYDESSKIATLVTCTNNINNAKERYVLHCLLTEVIKFN